MRVVVEDTRAERVPIWRGQRHRRGFALISWANSTNRNG
jgi:hypothetical protein